MVILATAGCSAERAPGLTTKAPPPGAASASPTRPPSTATPQPALIGTVWQLVEYSRNGQTTNIPATTDAALRLDGTGHYVAYTCPGNGMGGEMLVTGRFVDLEPGWSTLIVCGGAYGQADTAIVGAIATGQLTWSIDNQRLVLRQSNGDTLVFAAHDQSPPNLPPLVERFRTRTNVHTER